MNVADLAAAARNSNRGIPALGLVPVDIGGNHKTEYQRSLLCCGKSPGSEP